MGDGGGRDSQSAILFGHENITAIDVNPIFIYLLQTQFKDFAGIAGRDGVKSRSRRSKELHYQNFGKIFRNSDVSGGYMGSKCCPVRLPYLRTDSTPRKPGKHSIIT